MAKVKGIVAQCVGCGYVTPLAGMCFKLADMYAPAGFWRRGGCPYATHIVKTVEATNKVRVGQQKQKKKKA